MILDMIEASRPWDTPGTEVESPYRNLAAAIVLKAVQDYKKTLKAMWKNPRQARKKQELSMRKLELESFFYSPDFQMYCDLSPDKVIEQCRLQAIGDEKRAIARKTRNRIHQEKAMRTLGLQKQAGSTKRIEHR